MRVSVICTVLNEGESIRRLMDSLANQTRPPEEIVIVDGGSRDNTVAVLNEYAGRLPLHVLVEPGANISHGRNVAIANTTGDVDCLDGRRGLAGAAVAGEAGRADGRWRWQIANRKSQIAHGKSQTAESRRRASERSAISYGP